jgi:hypothetical protein
VWSLLAQIESEPATLTIPTWMKWGIPAASLVAVVYLLHAISKYGGRERALRQLAAREGMTFSATDPSTVASLRFNTFADAKGVTLTNVVSLRDGTGRTTRAFDYSLWSERETWDGNRDTFEGIADEVFGLDTPVPRRTVRTYAAEA